MLRAALARLAGPVTRVPWQRRVAGGFVLAAFCMAATLSAPADDPIRSLDALGVVLLVVPALVAPWASVALVPALAVTAVAPVVFYAFGYASIFTPAPAMLAVFTAVLLGRASYAVAAVTAACFGAYAAGLGHGLTPSAAAVGPLWILAWMVAAGGVGEALRKRRQLLEAERERAATAAQRGAEQERLRIARELHDSLTHSISVINVQASVAAHLIDREPDRIPTALATIRTASAEALHELRSTVEVLRRIDTAADPADEPVSSLARLPQLVAHSRAAGLDVEVTSEVDPGPLPPAVDRAAYRIVQESLTNAARHAPGSRVRLTIACRPHTLEITVHNGPPRAGAAPGTAVGGGAGLVGMRERIDAIGGTLHAAPYDGGFRVHAVLALPGLASREAVA